jgi:hypothetical protein
MTYQEMTEQIFALPANQRDAAADDLLKSYNEPDKELVEIYIYEAIAAADDTTQVFLL